MIGNSKEMEHRKFSRGTGCNNGLSNSTSCFYDDSAIICEILSRLPVKSLVRFKCVCKRWRFLIEEDFYFIGLHLNQSQQHPTFLFVKPINYSQTWVTPRRTKLCYSLLELLIVDMLEDKQSASATSSITINTTKEMQFPYGIRGFFGPVNGLMGFHSKKYPAGTCIYNVSTRKVSPWIKSTFPREVKSEGRSVERIPHYEMGYDPATKKHKVICIWPPPRIITWNRHNKALVSFELENICEVLTVGDNKWRKIEYPPFELEMVDEHHKRKQHAVYVNGFIYYCTSTFTKACEVGYDKIVAFDVGAEKFRVITVPNFILNQPRYVYEDGTSPNHLLELEGRLALIQVSSSAIPHVPRFQVWSRAFSLFSSVLLLS